MKRKRTCAPEGPARSCIRAIRLAAVLTVALAASGCNNDERFNVERWPVTIENRSGLVLDIDLDGRPVATVAVGASATVPDVEEGNHVLEAFDRSGRLVAERSFFLAREFVWILE